MKKDSLIGSLFTPFDNSHAQCIDEEVPTNHSLAGTSLPHDGPFLIEDKPAVQCIIVTEPFKMNVRSTFKGIFVALDFVIVVDPNTGLRHLVMYRP